MSPAEQLELRCLGCTASTKWRTPVIQAQDPASPSGPAKGGEGRVSRRHRHRPNPLQCAMGAGCGWPSGPSGEACGDCLSVDRFLKARRCGDVSLTKPDGGCCTWCPLSSMSRTVACRVAPFSSTWRSPLHASTQPAPLATQTLLQTPCTPCSAGHRRPAKPRAQPAPARAKTNKVSQARAAHPALARFIGYGAARAPTPHSLSILGRPLPGLVPPSVSACLLGKEGSCHARPK